MWDHGKRVCACRPIAAIGGVSMQSSTLRRVILFVALVSSLRARPLLAATTVVQFDPPQFAAGQVVTEVAGVRFPDAPIVFAPSRVTTSSPPNALRSPRSTLTMTFDAGASLVSVRVGNDDDLTANAGLGLMGAEMVAYDSGSNILSITPPVIWGHQSAAQTADIALELRIVNSESAIRFVVVSFGGYAEGQIPYGQVQLDELTFTMQDGPPPPPPPPPTISLDPPLENRCYYNRCEPLRGQVSPRNVRGVCTWIDDAPVPMFGDPSCIPVNPTDGTFAVFPKGCSALPAGTEHTLHAIVYDFYGQSTTAEMQRVVPAAFTDLRILGMEVSQGIQPDGLTHNVAGVPRPYEGVRLIEGKKTVVRVFANRGGDPCYENFAASARLIASRPPDPRPFGEPLSPGNPTIFRMLELGDDLVTTAERSSPRGVFVFTLPPSWVTRWRYNDPEITLNLTAELDVFRGPLECDGCFANNRMVMTDIHFSPSAPVTVKPVELIWYDSSGTLRFPGAPATVWRWLTPVLPTARANIKPYVATVDASGSVTKYLNGAFSTCTLGSGTCGDGSGNCDKNALQFCGCPAECSEPARRYLIARLLAMVSGVEATRFTEHLISGTYGVGLVGAIDPPIELGRETTVELGMEQPVTFCCRLDAITRLPLPLWRGIALIQPHRPLGVAVHEVLHQYGIYHAGVLCPGALNGSCLATDWPPDERGKLHGIGIDVSRNSFTACEKRQSEFNGGQGAFCGDPAAPQHTCGRGDCRKLISCGDMSGRCLRNASVPCGCDADCIVGGSNFGRCSGTCGSTMTGACSRDASIPCGCDTDCNLGSCVTREGYKIMGPPDVEWVDLMSYCGDGRDGNLWISPENWQQFYDAALAYDDSVGGGPIGLGNIPSACYAAALSDAQPISEPTLRVVGYVAAGAVEILDVGRGAGGGVVSGAEELHHRLTVRDAGGGVQWTTPLAVNYVGHPGEELAIVTAEVPAAGAESIEISEDGIVKAIRMRTAQTPTVTVLLPEKGARVSGDSVTVRWVADDADGDELTARVDYSVDDGLTFRTITSNVAGDEVSLPGRYFSRARRARVRIVVNDGFNEAEAISERFRSKGAPPEVRILDPDSDTSIAAGTELYLSGDAYDDGGEPLPDRRLRWRDGRHVLGRGRRLSVGDLSVGTHEIKLEARGRPGHRASTSRYVHVVLSPLVAPSQPQVCCASAAIRVCSWENSVDACTTTGGIAGEPGSVCDALTGGCAPAPAELGNCCEHPNGGCSAGPDADAIACASAGSVPRASAVCSPVGVCVY